MVLLPNIAEAEAQALWRVLQIEHELARLVELGATELEPVRQMGGGIKAAAVTARLATDWV